MTSFFENLQSTIIKGFAKASLVTGAIGGFGVGTLGGAAVGAAIPFGLLGVATLGVAGLGLGLGLAAAGGVAAARGLGTAAQFTGNHLMRGLAYAPMQAIATAKAFEYTGRYLLTGSDAKKGFIDAYFPNLSNPMNFQDSNKFADRRFNKMFNQTNAKIAGLKDLGTDEALAEAKKLHHELEGKVSARRFAMNGKIARRIVGTGLVMGAAGLATSLISNDAPDASVYFDKRGMRFRGDGGASGNYGMALLNKSMMSKESFDPSSMSQILPHLL